LKNFVVEMFQDLLANYTGQQFLLPRGRFIVMVRRRGSEAGLEEKLAVANGFALVF
jgi:hypothetical protein